MASPFSPSQAPYGPTAPAYDMIPLDAPGVDTPLSSPARAFLVLTDGTVSVTTYAGQDRTFDCTAGTTIMCCITHVLAENTCDLLVYL